MAMAATAVTAAGAQDATSGMLFLPYNIFLNYTNEYSKVLCLQMQMSGAVEKGDGLGINRALRVFFFFFSLLTIRPSRS